MPTINALTTVSAGELPGLDNSFIPIVSNSQTKKLQFKQLRETLVPKMLQQAATAGTDQLIFNNPSSITVDVYGRVTAVLEGSGEVQKISGILLDQEDFQNAAGEITSGVPLIAHKDRFAFAPTNLSLVPPFSVNKTGHITSGQVLTNTGLYSQRSNAFSTVPVVGLGTPLSPPIVDQSIYNLIANVQNITVENLSDFTNYLKIVLYCFQNQENTITELVDRVNLLNYALRQYNLGTTAGYSGAQSSAFTLHRSTYLGLFNFIPAQGAAQVGFAPSGGTNNASNYYRLSLVDGPNSGPVVAPNVIPQVGMFRSPLFLAPTTPGYSTSRIFKELVIDVAYVPLAALIAPATPGLPNYTWAGYAGNIQAITKKYTFKATDFPGNSTTYVPSYTPPAGSAATVGAWSSEVGSDGVRYIRLHSPTIAELRTVNLSFATGLDTAVSGSEDWYKNQLTMSLQYTAVADAQWIPSATNAQLPNTANTNQTQLVSYGNSGTFIKQVLRVA